MYPQDVTQLTALIAALIPFSIWIFSALIAAQTRSAERRNQQWKRISDLAQLLYNKEGSSGQWAQVAAIHELGDARGRHQRLAAKAILSHANQYFAGNTELLQHLAAAIKRL